MNEPKWTPGPWLVEAVSDAVRVYVKLARHSGRGFVKVILARCAPPQLPEDETHANARLMATAPELAEFVQREYDATNCICKLNAIGGTDVFCTNCAAAVLLAKARGDNKTPAHAPNRKS